MGCQFQGPIPSFLHALFCAQCDCLNPYKAEPCANTLCFKDFCHLHGYNEANTIGSVLKHDGLGSMVLTCDLSCIGGWGLEDCLSSGV